jgi:hypothetical protein
LLSSTQSINNPVISFLYPNPTTGNLFFNNPDEAFATIKIYDVSGRVIYSKQITAGNNEIDLSECGNGVFFVEVVMRSGERVFDKVLKAK